MDMSAEAVRAFRCPRWEELPAIPLYMDQVVLILEDILKIFTADEEKLVTSSMINNYVKQKLISAPEKKKYDRSHLSSLIVVCLLKKVLSISETEGIIALLVETRGREAAYNLFCEELEGMLRLAFDNEGYDKRGFSHYNDEIAPLYAALVALVGKLMVEKIIAEEMTRKLENAKNEKVKSEKSQKK